MVLIPSSERRALCGIVRVQGEEARYLVVGRTREEVVAQVVVELVVGAVTGAEFRVRDRLYVCIEAGRAYLMFQAPEARNVPSSSELPAIAHGSCQNIEKRA